MSVKWLRLASVLTVAMFASTMQQVQAGAVAMPDRYSATVAKDIIESGGSAVDAAIASAFVLAVTYPEAGNLGGGGFMLIHQNGESHFLDYRETAPSRAHRDMFLDENGNVIERGSLTGGDASGTPGTVMGMWQAHQRFGKLSWDALLEPAIELAESGFMVDEHLANEQQLFVNDGFAEGSNFLSYFSGLVAGERFVQQELAETLKRIKDHGPSAFYAGQTAQLIVAQMERTGGLISLDDLASYEAVWRDPVQIDWLDRTVVTVAPPSSGGIALAQILGMSEVLPLAEQTHNSAQYVHLLSEIYKQVYADRAKYLGDPDFVEVPVSLLMNRRYINNRAANVNHSEITATDEVEAGLYESPQTTHFSIVDNDGNAVSNTYTLNWSFGSGNVVEGAGFLMNNEMDDFSAKPGVPNVFGVIGGDANAIEPRKRMLSSMTPTIVLGEDGVDAVTGTPGGSKIITTVAQTLFNHYLFGMSAEEAVSATRFHHQLYPIDHITSSESLEPEVNQTLRSLGYTLEETWMGDAQMIVRQGSDYKGGSDPRGRGVALSF